MGLRYRKSIKLGKGARINISKTGVGLSVGTSGFRYTVHSSGRRTATVGIPKTGIYYTASSTTKKSKSSSKASAAKARKQAEKQEQLMENQRAVDEYESYLRHIETLHQNTIPAIDWNQMEQTPPPFMMDGVGFREHTAREELNSYRPGILEKTLLHGESRKKGKLLEQVEEARKADQEEYEEWKIAHELAGGMIALDVDAYQAAMETYAPLEEISEYCSDFDLVIADPLEMTVEFDAHGNEVIPAEEKSLTKSGKLSVKPLSKTKYFDYLQDYVCSCAIRVARDLFAILPLQSVVVNVKDTVINTTKGIEESRYILSVRFQRERFNSTVFNRIDTSDFVESFKCHMKFGKHTGFRPVKPL